jgi:hypothetical protein
MGPGYYTSPSKMGSGYSASIRHKVVGPATDKSPGPGSYSDVKMSKTKYSSTVVKTSSPRKTMNSTTYPEPGPGYYEPLQYKQFVSKTKGLKNESISPRKSNAKSSVGPGYSTSASKNGSFSPSKANTWCVSHEERQYNQYHNTTFISKKTKTPT